MVMYIGRRVGMLREAHGESLREAAVRTGVSHTTIARIEKGEVVNSFQNTLFKIARGYGVSMEYLLTGRDPSRDLEALFKLQSLGDGERAPVPTAAVDAYVRLVRKAVEAGIQPHVLDMALDLLAAKHPSLPTEGNTRKAPERMWA